METITTRTVGAGFAEIPEFILTETPTTSIIFQPQMHDDGVRGRIVRVKKDRNGNREAISSINFRELNPGDGVKIEINTEGISNLFRRIQELYTILEDRGVQPGTHHYRVADRNDIIITDRNKAQIIRRMLEANLGEEVWEQLVRSDPDIATRLANSKIHEDRQEALSQFNTMLSNNNLLESDWQEFFEHNTWIFGYGLRYQILRVIQAQPNYGGAALDGVGGQRGDFLTATEAETKFTCLVEIKKPNISLLQREQYRNGAYGISRDLAGAISQVQVNCAQWEISDARTDQNRDVLTDIHTVSPKGIVVVGHTRELDTREKRNSFERFRRELRSPEIVTFDELFERARFITES